MAAALELGQGLGLGYHVGDALELARQLPTGSIQCIVTSPPYWGLRDYGVVGQWGLEASLAEFVGHLVDLGRELRRVLRPDGTLWLNLGDGYAVDGCRGNRSAGFNERWHGRGSWNGKQGTAPVPGGDWRGIGGSGVKPKDLIGMPWRVALALQADGWWVRSSIIWEKPNPMPESIRDRPTSAYEHLFLLATTAAYYYDQEAIREPHSVVSLARLGRARGRAKCGCPPGTWVPTIAGSLSQSCHPGGRNARNVWRIPTEAVREKHYATFPRALVRRCLLAGTSRAGACAACGAPRHRVVERVDPTGRLGASWHDHQADLARGQRGCPPGQGRPVTVTTGWEPTCSCGAPTAPCVVLDPFMGSGTTAIVCDELGLDWLGFDLDQRNISIYERRLAADRARRERERARVERRRARPTTTPARTSTPDEIDPRQLRLPGTEES